MPWRPSGSGAARTARSWRGPSPHRFHAPTGSLYRRLLPRLSVAHLECAVATGVRQVRPSVQEYKLQDGRRLHVLGEGRLINLAGAEGHPAAVMDMSFANQSLCAEYIAKNAKQLERKVYDVPEDIDAEVARLKLHAMGIKIDKLTDEQRRYLSSWEEGT